jgi:hypothetical protein
MCKHVNTVEAMRSTVLELRKAVLPWKPDMNVLTAIAYEEARYDYWLDKTYAHGCPVCQSLIYQPEWAERQVEEEWFSSLTPKVSGFVRS